MTDAPVREFVRGELLYFEHELAELPDHTAVSWRRIHGDESSRAIAYVSKAPDPDLPAGTDGPLLVWLSPGGYRPLSPAEAELNYPLTVEVLPYGYPTALEPAWGTVVSGGTYPRDHALESATRLLAGTGASANAAIDVAESFVAWLDPETTTEAQLEPAGTAVDWLDQGKAEIAALRDAVGGMPSSTLDAYRGNLANRLEAALETLREASAWNGGDLISLAARGRIATMVESLRTPPKAGG